MSERERIEGSPGPGTGTRDLIEVSIVVPVLNEGANVAPLAARVQQTLRTSGVGYELIFVDDGSSDDTAKRVIQLHEADPAIHLVQLSRNFGHQAALFAGIESARGAAVITLDGDLQHPPELIPRFLEHWRAGFEIVQGVRRKAEGVSAIRSATSTGFYHVLSRLAKIQVAAGAADFRLMARPAVEAFLACRERVRFNRGLVQWIGFSTCEVVYDAGARRAGQTKYTWSRMLRLAADAIFSFSSWPLRLAGLAGAIVSLAAGAYLAFVLWARVFTQYTIAGWTSILAALLVLGGVQLIVLWIIGEYLGRLYEEAKQRPLYIIRRSTTTRANSDPLEQAPP